MPPVRVSGPDDNDLRGLFVFSAFIDDTDRSMLLRSSLLRLLLAWVVVLVVAAKPLGFSWHTPLVWAQDDDDDDDSGDDDEDDDDGGGKGGGDEEDDDDDDEEGAEEDADQP